MTSLTFDATAATAWLRQPCPDLPEATRAECLGVDELFGPGVEGFLSTVGDILAAEPAGLRYRSDITGVMLWRIPDGDVLDHGALITVDLANDIRLATLHQDVKDFADRRQNGIPAAVSALGHITGQVCLLVERYERTNPDYQPQPRVKVGGELHRLCVFELDLTCGHCVTIAVNGWYPVSVACCDRLGGNWAADMYIPFSPSVEYVRVLEERYEHRPPGAEREATQLLTRRDRTDDPVVPSEPRQRGSAGRFPERVGGPRPHACHAPPEPA